MNDYSKLDVAFFETLFEQASDGFIAMDEALQVRYMNRTAKQWFGEPLQRPMTCGQLISCKAEHGESLQTDKCFGCLVFSRRASLAEKQMTVRKITGCVIPVSVSYSYIPYHDDDKYVVMAIRDISAQKKLEQERLVNETLRFTIEERERIARDLHDTVAQDLAFAALQLKRLRKEVNDTASTPGCPALSDSLKMIGDSIDHSIDELRSSLYDLSFVLETDFIQFVRDSAIRLESRSGIPTNVVIQDSVGSWPDKVEEQLARIVKEVFTNIYKHARASHVTVTVNRSDKAMEVTIEDDGCGFEIDEQSPFGHFGFRSITERCRLLGGKATVATEQGKGTTWHLFIPGVSELVS